MAKIISGLRNWKELGLPSLQYPEEWMLKPSIDEAETSDTFEGALAILEHHLGFTEPSINMISKTTPLWPLNLKRENLPHIVEKRKDARERYATMALDTLSDPYEVWEAMYDDDLVRYKFIGMYRQRYQMLVVIAPWNGRVMWNFMQMELKSLNSHRQGNLLYSRP